MHKALKLKRVADALAAAGGGWLPLTLKAWRKYVRRKRGKENARPALVAKPVVALPPPPPVAEPPVLDTCAKLQPPSPPLCQTYAAPPVPPAMPVVLRVQSSRGVVVAWPRRLRFSPRGGGDFPRDERASKKDSSGRRIETDHPDEA
mgnify:CR=1 FL=1